MSDDDIIYFASLIKADYAAAFQAWVPDNLHLVRWYYYHIKSIWEIEGRGHYSVRDATGKLRQDTTLREQYGDFKIDNRTTPYIARLLLLANPTWVGKFEVRRVNGESRSWTAFYNGEV